MAFIDWDVWPYKEEFKKTSIHHQSGGDNDQRKELPP